MTGPATSFREFERSGWEDVSVCAHYDEKLWDVPDKAVGFGAIYGAVRIHGSMDVGLPPGPSFQQFSDPEPCKRILADAGFEAPSVSHVAQVWRVSTPERVFDDILTGSVRAAATLRGQSAQAREAIRAAVGETISAFRRGEVYEVPMSAVLAGAVKPAP